MREDKILRHLAILSSVLKINAWEAALKVGENCSALIDLLSKEHPGIEPQVKPMPTTSKSTKSMLSPPLPSRGIETKKCQPRVETETQPMIRFLQIRQEELPSFLDLINEESESPPLQIHHRRSSPVRIPVKPIPRLVSRKSPPPDDNKTETQSSRGSGDSLGSLLPKF
jgi:hypothetical protein